MSVKTSITNTETNSFDTNTSNVKKLTIATISDVAPFNFSDEKGAITGFDSDVLHCQKKLNIQFKPTTFASLFCRN